MSKMLNGPPGSPLPLCSGTSMTAMRPTVPCVSVPQVGQTDEPFPQLLANRNAASTPARTTKGNIFDLIESPPAIFARGPTCLKKPNSLTQRSGMRSCRPPYESSKFPHPRRCRCLLEPELDPLQCHEVVSGQDSLHARILQPVHVEVELQQDPVIEIPVEPSAELVCMVALGGEDCRRDRAGIDRNSAVEARRLSLHVGIPELH